MVGTILKNPTEGFENRFAGNFNDVPEDRIAVGMYSGGLIVPEWNGSIWIEGATPEEILEHNISLIPKEISRMKFKIQIRRSTIYSYDIILEYLKNLAINETFTQDDKDELIDRLEDAVSFNRYHKDFINLANMLGVSDEIKDEIFIEGNKIE